MIEAAKFIAMMRNLLKLVASDFRVREVRSGTITKRRFFSYIHISGGIRRPLRNEVLYLVLIALKRRKQLADLLSKIERPSQCERGFRRAEAAVMKQANGQKLFSKAKVLRELGPGMAWYRTTIASVIRRPYGTLRLRQYRLKSPSSSPSELSCLQISCGHTGYRGQIPIKIPRANVQASRRE